MIRLAALALLYLFLENAPDKELSDPALPEACLLYRKAFLPQPDKDTGIQKTPVLHNKVLLKRRRQRREDTVHLAAVDRIDQHIICPVLCRYLCQPNNLESAIVSLKVVVELLAFFFRLPSLPEGFPSPAR